MLRRPIIALLVTMLCLPAVAQMRGGMGRGGFASRGGSFHGHHGFPDGGLLGSSFFFPDYFPDYEAGQPYAEEPVPQFVIVQQAADSSPRRPKASPLLIEWRGDRYVRYGGAQENDQHENSVHPDYAEPAPARASTNRPVSMMPTVLVYRDGHRQEISDYAIADGVIYVQGTYWQNGSLTKPIPLASLDPVATIQANQQRGVRFILPTASNVVVASF